MRWSIWWQWPLLSIDCLIRSCRCNCTKIVPALSCSCEPKSRRHSLVHTTHKHAFWYTICSVTRRSFVVVSYVFTRSQSGYFPWRRSIHKCTGYREIFTFTMIPPSNHHVLYVALRYCKQSDTEYNGVYYLWKLNDYICFWGHRWLRCKFSGHAFSSHCLVGKCSGCTQSGSIQSAFSKHHADWNRGGGGGGIESVNKQIQKHEHLHRFSQSWFHLQYDHGCEGLEWATQGYEAWQLDMVLERFSSMALLL